MSTKGHLFARGMRDGIPVGLGYLAVGFSLGITAKAAGLDALQGFFASLFTIASAGEYAGFRVIAAQGAYLEMALVIFFGLKGAAVGTFAAMLYHTCYFALYLRKNILDRPFWHFAKYMLTDAVTAGAAWWLTRGFEMSAVGYGAWCVLALKVTGVTFLVCAAVNFLVYRKEIAGLMEFFRHRRK